MLSLSLYLLVEDDSNLGGGHARFGYVNCRFRVGRTNLNYYRQPEFRIFENPFVVKNTSSKNSKGLRDFTEWCGETV